MLDCITIWSLTIGQSHLQSAFFVVILSGQHVAFLFMISFIFFLLHVQMYTDALNIRNMHFIQQTSCIVNLQGGINYCVSYPVETVMTNMKFTLLLLFHFSIGKLANRAQKKYRYGNVKFNYIIRLTYIKNMWRACNLTLFPPCLTGPVD
jgi:hypothetical protein